MEKRRFLQRWHWFQLVSCGFLLIFFGIMFVVLLFAYARQSGTAKLDMATMQKIRFEANKKN